MFTCIFSYGEGQCGVAYRYMIYLTHIFNNPGYDYAKVMGKSAKYFGKCKQSRLLPNVKKCKLVKTSIVYRKYHIITYNYFDKLGFFPFLYFFLKPSYSLF